MRRRGGGGEGRGGGINHRVYIYIYVCVCVYVCVSSSLGVIAIHGSAVHPASHTYIFETLTNDTTPQNTHRNKNITLRLVWDHMPLTGGLFMRSGTPSHTVLPDQYT
jgi:hypothetical protein